ncbi:hypothetical protein NRY95_21210 [Xanthomonas campestris pv. phormiicola]|nr:hypothetical protein NRY95_21210 [Xanthomonas campestris pv. phormiicola]
MKARERVLFETALHAFEKARHACSALARNAVHATGMRTCGKA